MRTRCGQPYALLSEPAKMTATLLFRNNMHLLHRQGGHITRSHAHRTAYKSGSLHSVGAYPRVFHTFARLLEHIALSNAAQGSKHSGTTAAWFGGVYRWWLSDEACMFSGLSEDGTITVPVKRFASPCVFWFALCVRYVGQREQKTGDQ
jgi:hypothetical protein